MARAVHGAVGAITAAGGYTFLFVADKLQYYQGYECRQYEQNQHSTYIMIHIILPMLLRLQMRYIFACGWV